MNNSSIEWTDDTWNPVSGCSQISPGCAHCYAKTMFGRPYPGRAFEDVRCHPDRLEQPLHMRKPRRIFVNSMSDLFHEDVPAEFILRVFDVMERAHWHTFQVLTKRAARMVDILGGSSGAGLSAPPLPNVWLGVSVENQRVADERIPLLLETPAAVRFISAEPLLGPIDFHSPVLEADSDGYLDWVIVGGESGPKARPFDVAWARSIVAQCKAAGVPCFVKQLGAKPVRMLRTDCVPHDVELRSRKGGDPSEWPEDLRVREYPR